MSAIVQMRKIKQCSVVGVAAHGTQLGRHGRLSLMQVNV